MEDKKDVEKIKAETPRAYQTMRSIPPNTLFRLQKSQTIYFKMPDGSVRNMEKAAKKLGLTKGKKS
jgi:hypothetical protein